jgi:hypothetical protein
MHFSFRLFLIHSDRKEFLQCIIFSIPLLHSLYEIPILSMLHLIEHRQMCKAMRAVSLQVSGNLSLQISGQRLSFLQANWPPAVSMAIRLGRPVTTSPRPLCDYGCVFLCLFNNPVPILYVLQRRTANRRMVLNSY